MNTEVVEAICEKLGVAFTNASDFVNYILPQYAKMEVIFYGAFVTLSVLILIFSFIVMFLGFKNREKDYDFAFALWCISGVLIVVSLFIMFCTITPMIQWIVCPEAKMFDVMMSSLK